MKIVALGCLLFPVACVVQPPSPPPPGPIQHVIHISVDGLRPDSVTTLGRGLAPNFFRLRDEGAFTDNARTDALVANTLPNHAAQFTSRGVFGDDGHGLFINDDPGPPVTLRLIKGSYVAGVFDVVHDAGLSTGFYASKSKFALFDRSWNEIFGAPDETGADNGRDKTDVTFIDGSMSAVVSRFVTDMAQLRYVYAFLHLREPDSTGHRANWDLAAGSEYQQTVIAVDGLLGDILDLVDSDPELSDTTAIILTADHGGELGENFHLLLPDVGLIESGIVPFYVWGATVSAGADLYALNATTRRDPGRSIPPFSDSPQPIRNGDAANLALDMLALPAVPDSTINTDQSLAVSN
ncbi:MAG: alkaline phosphatase family protein [Gammaproteobacteria bacterium]|nr:alkaline phosphatase family protein [Gammaproteobacteria bacterium]